MRELSHELGAVASSARRDVEDSAAARRAVGAYLWLMQRTPRTTAARLITFAVLILIFLVPSLALLYVSLTSGQQETQSWFGDLGYGGVFLSNLASTATLFFPVPGLTAAAQALIASSSSSLSPLVVGILGGLGMALGEVTAYVAGRAASVIAREEEIKPPRRLQPLIDRLTRSINRLMHRWGMPTLFTLSVVPNPLFEVAGWTAGATRYSFWKFMASVVPGKVTRGLLLAYLGERIIFG